MYDLTIDPTEQRNLAHPVNADERSREALARMKKIPIETLAAKRHAPATGGLLPATTPARGV
ncbi:MAG: hypothetical protein IPH90_07385 [Thermomonas sp.]|nr:hypothetical protein [Thermomonas sp.]